MAGRYKVTAAAVVLPTKDGSERYLYRGAPILGEAFTEDGIKHAVSVGLITEVEEPAEKAPETVEIPVGEPSEDWTGKQLDAYAAAKGIELGSGKNKAEKIAAITAAVAA